jgi:uncharacterized repeat protein (TIGR03803 family)
MRHQTFCALPARVFLLFCLIASLDATASASKFKVLHAFKGGTTDGAYPLGPLVLDRSGNAYGITEEGGSTNCSGYGCGVAFKLAPGTNSWKETVFYTFQPYSGGFNSFISGLAPDNKGNFYGITNNGGYGTVYQLTRSGGPWTDNTIHTFTSTPDGGYPSGTLVRDAAGNLYGVTAVGGANGDGCVYQLSLNSDGTWAENIIYSFTYINYGGYGPAGSLAIDAAGNLYGTTQGGGLWNWGIAYKLSHSNGSWTETTLYDFTLNYSTDVQTIGVVLDPAGNLYGVTLFDGEYGLGTIYKLTPTQGLWNKTVLYTFTGGSDGGNPLAGL